MSNNYSNKACFGDSIILKQLSSALYFVFDELCLCANIFFTQFLLSLVLYTHRYLSLLIKELFPSYLQLLCIH